jgi:hypothetical protein
VTGDDEISAVDRNRFRVASVDSVEANEVGEVFGVDQIVDRHEL